MKKLYKLDNINLNYNINGNDIRVLKNINFEIKKNERVALTGESGSGKTSLLMLMSGLENPSKGSLIFENKDFSKISEEQKTTIRKKKIGLVFQQFYLIPNYTALENVMFPMQINKIKNEKEKASLILSDIGLDNRKNNLPSELSGGERRRVALCRLLLKQPDVLLLDEPTNHLDAESIDWLEQHLEQYQGTVLCVTHDRYFLDNVAGWILELDRGEGIPYEGNYQNWLEQKTKKLAQEEKQESKRKKELDKELEWIRTSPKGRRAKNKARISNYEIMLSDGTKEKNTRLQIPIPNGPRLGNKVLEVKDLQKSYGDKSLF